MESHEKLWKEGRVLNQNDVTQLLVKLQNDPNADLGALFQSVYEQLRQLANHHLAKERSNHTLQPTALLHEAFLRIGDGKEFQFDSRNQFFAFASQTMRRILVDHARRKGAEKRGGQVVILDLEQNPDVPVENLDPETILAIDQALEKLAKVDARKAQFLQEFYFSGLGAEEIADCHGLDASSVRRLLRAARKWLAFQLRLSP